MRYSSLLFRAIFALLIASSVGRAEQITVSAAVSLKEALTQIARDYEKQSGDTVELQFGASGQLAAQIKQGAPVDLFISAARKQVDDLAADKTVDASTSVVVANNSLVLIIPAKATAVPSTIQDLTEPRFRKIAIGDPKTVPAGDYANQSLTALGLADRVKDRLIQGTNVRQVLSYVERNEVDAGIVYKTDAMESGDLVKVVATFDEKVHQPIEYPAVLVTASKHRTAAGNFLKYIQTGPAGLILQAKGFALPAKGPTTRP